MAARPGISRERLLDALERAGGQRKRAAELLGVGRATLYRWMERYGFSADTGRIISGRYEAVSELGAGNQGRVLLVRDRLRGGEERALKLLRNVSDPEEVRRLREEYRILARLRHPGLVRVHDFGLDDGTQHPFLVMDRIEGETFTDAALDTTVREVLERFLEALSAVGHLHRHGLLHRDLKPENVLVAGGRGPGAVRVTDLGLSEPLAGPELPAGGTLLYCAPEILDGARASARTDLYALGVMLYVALCREPPFEGSTAKETVRAHREGGLTPPSQARSGLPPQLDRFVARLLERDPALRFPDCAAAEEALASLLDGDAEGASRPPRQRFIGAEELVGREQEVLDLARRLDDSEPGDEVGLLLEGEGGIGKSRLVEALGQELRARGFRVASAACPADAAAGARPLAELVAEALGGAPTPGGGVAGRLVERHRSALSALDGERWSWPESEESAKPSPPSRAQLLEELCRLLLEIAERQPLALVIDDLHQADPLVLDALRLLTGKVGKRRLKLIAGARPHGDLLRDLRAAGLWVRHPVGALGLEPVIELTAKALGAAQGSMLGSRLHELTGGHPLYLQAVLRELAEAPEPAGLEGLTSRLPASLAQALGSRIDRTSPQAARWLQALAARGGAARIADVEELTGVQACEAFEPLVRLGLLREAGPDGVDVAHGLLRDAVWERLDADGRLEWHRRWAALLRDRPGTVVERASHLLDARAGAEARSVYLDAADELERTWRHARALRLLQAATELLEVDDPERLSLYERLERACRVVRDDRGAVEVCGRWAELAEALGREGSQARALAMLASWHRERGEVEAGIEAAERAVVHAERAGDPAVIGEALKVRASARWIAWKREEAWDDFERAVESVRRSGDPVRIGFCLADVALPRAQRGDVSGALAAFEEALELLQGPGSELWALLTRTIRGYVLGYVGDLEGAIAEIESAVTDLRRLRAPVALTDPLENLALYRLRAGRYEAALESARALVEEGIRYARPRYRLSGLLAMGEARLHLDAREAARDHDRLALELAEELGEPGQLQFARLAVARDARLNRDHETATRLARAAYDQARARGNPRQWGRAAWELARSSREAGRLDEARAWLRRANAALDASWEDAPALRAACLGETAHLHAREGLRVLATADLHEALGQVRRCGPAHQELELLLQLGHLESERGRADEANAAFARARRLIERIAAEITSAEDRARFLGRPDFGPLRQRGPVRDGAAGEDRGEGASVDLRALYEVSRAIAGRGDSGPLFDRVVEVALERVGGERAALVLRDEATGRLVVAASNGLEAETQKEVSRLSRGVLERADRGQAVWVTDTSLSPDLAQSVSVAMFGIRSVMCVPLRVGSEVLGTLYVDSRGEGVPFDERSLRFLEAVADQAAVALAYARLMQDLTRERDALRESLVDAEAFEGLIGRSAAMRNIFELIDRVAPTTLPVIVSGESGTGKELVARAIHRRSARGDAPFMTENCAAIPEGLLESTLFGHVRGAFTGADEDRPGLFERAHGGTLLLDEIGDMSPGLQAKLLRVLQEGELRRVGGAEPIAVDVRVVAATHRDLEQLIREGSFRQDLYFRLNGITVTLPPLRSRREDIPSLVRHFLEVESAAARRPVPKLEPSVWRSLLAHDWPGNVRELHTAVRRLLLLSPERWIGTDVVRTDPELGALLGRLSAGDEDGEGRTPARPSGVSRAQIERALARTGGNRKEAAALLGISRATLYRKLDRAGRR